MRHDVCTKQRLYDEFVEELQEACLDALYNAPSKAPYSDSVPEWFVVDAVLPYYRDILKSQVTIGIYVEL